MSKQKPQDNKAADLQQQVGELTEALQRERADAVNLRRQYENQIANLKNNLKASLVSEIIPILDDIKRLSLHRPPELSDDTAPYSQAIWSWINGVEMIGSNADRVLEDLGVERIKTVGEPFDPHLHEAVSMEEGEGEQEIVSEELQSGYKMGDEVIRHAMVRVTQK